MKAVPLRRIATVTLGKMIQSACRDEADVEAPYLRAAHVQPHGVLIEVDDKTMWFSRAELDSLRLRSGDVVVVEGGAGYGRPAVIDTRFENWGFQNSINRIRPLPEYSHGRYLYYALEHVQQSGVNELAASVSTIPHLTAEKLSAIEIPVHGLNEQRRIADFLDRETAQIDATIVALRQLVERVVERRAEFVETAVERVDVVPSKLRWHVESLAGLAFLSGDFEEQGLGPRMLRGVNVKPGCVVWDQMVSLSREPEWSERPYFLMAGDLVIGLDRPFVGDGSRVALVSGSDVPALLVQRVLRLRAKDGDARYFKYLLEGRRFREYCEPIFTGVSVPHLSESQVLDYSAMIPSATERRSIADSLDREVERLDGMADSANEAVALLEERRAAVISAAVTGRIDPETGLEREEPAA